MTKQVYISEADFVEQIETYSSFYKCPACGKENIWREFNFCPDCGAKLIWVPLKKEKK